MARASTRILAALLVLFGIAACSSSGDVDEGSTDPGDRDWTLVELNGDEPLADVEVTLTIADGALSGSAGCNRYIGTVDLDEPSLTVQSDIAVTMMACLDEVMAQEQAYLATLDTVTGYAATEEELQLKDADDTVVARFN